MYYPLERDINLVTGAGYSSFVPEQIWNEQCVVKSIRIQLLLFTTSIL
jgi:hypothetical protein